MTDPTRDPLIERLATIENAVIAAVEALRRGADPEIIASALEANARDWDC